MTSRPGLGLCFAAVLAVACSASSTAQKASTTDGGRGDGAPGASSSAVPDGRAPSQDATPACNPFGTPGCNPGQVCCSSGVRGICTGVDSCASAIKVECWGPDGCNAGEVCCGTFVPAFSAPSPNGTPHDAAANPTATVVCAKDCAPPGAALCRSSADCRGGDRCALVPEGGNQGILAIAAEIIAVCTPQEGGAP